MARLVQSRGWSEEHARAVLAVQRPAEWFRDAADLTLDNTGEIADLERAARAAVVRLMAERRAALRAGVTETHADDQRAAQTSRPGTRDPR